MKVPKGYNPIFWRKYGRAISESRAELPRCDLKARATTITIKPRSIGTDQEGWQIGEKEIPCDTLEEAIIVAIEILNRA